MDETRSMLPILLISGWTLLASLLVFAGATAVVIRTVVGLLPAGQADPGFWKSAAVMTIVMLITAVMHLVEIALWGIVYLLCGEVSNLEAAFYFSAQNYTALGYGDLVLSAQWRLLGPLESINGLMLMGLSTASIFTVLNRLVTIHLRQGQSRSRRTRAQRKRTSRRSLQTTLRSAP